MNSYCLIHAHGWLVINSDTMHRKCRILRSKITEFRGMELCNLIGGYGGFGQDILLPSSDGL